MNADPSHKPPRERPLDQELGLFAFLYLSRDPGAGPSGGRHRAPVDLVELGEIGAILEVKGSRVRRCECPTAIVLVGPPGYLHQVALQMNNWPLTAVISKFLVIGTID